MRLISNGKAVGERCRNQEPLLVLPEHDQRVSRLVSAAFGSEDATAKMAHSLYETVLASPKILRSIAIIGFSTSFASSLIAGNLAVVSAQTQSKTLLLDANLAEQSQDWLFKVPPPNKILFDLFGGNSELQDAILPTAISNLSVLRSGSVPDKTSTGLQREQVREIMSVLEDRFALTIVDAGDIEQSAVTISAAAQAVIMVVRKNHTPMAKIVQIASRLRNCDTAILGTIISDH